ncbi:hypothetical protein GF108_08400 [Phyllobacterium sp. SYP-B3895]|uniref:hypothetical protein n=1 Tax=Phyllobacterium sp. SYP-B3895 TaxID=2663240 RepID=UPI001299F73B|nr:hypothetical protein [Phyllobacterium sp. SYP-B3895]MRG55601.1 hypothetical protein [Phyllobacterium sp. SYP-B3895]
MIDEKVTPRTNPDMLSIMFNQGFIQHLLLLIFNRMWLQVQQKNKPPRAALRNVSG